MVDKPGPDADAPKLPSRELRDANMLRALAHPARIKLLEELAFRGPMTATELAAQLDESAANCSWHLRQLQRYGFVEEAGGGTGRRRPWRAVIQRNQWRDNYEDADLAAAANAAANVMLSHELEALAAWRAQGSPERPDWQDVPFVAQSVGWLTADELTRAGEEISQVLTRYLSRVNDPDARPAGARPIRFVAWGIPAVSHETPLNAATETPPTESPATETPATETPAF